MIITSIQIRKFENTGNKMKGVCTLVLDDMIAIHDIKILENPQKDCLFFAMPSKKVFTGTNEGRFVDIVHPINKEAREKLEEIIFGLYKNIVDNINPYATYVNKNTECTSLLQQVASDFIIEELPIKSIKPDKPIKQEKPNVNFAQNKNLEGNESFSDSMKSKLEAWLAE